MKIPFNLYDIHNSSSIHYKWLLYMVYEDDIHEDEWVYHQGSTKLCELAHEFRDGIKLV